MDLIESDEHRKRIESQLPEGITHIFFSSIMEQGLTELKDLLWKALNKPI